MTKQFIGLISIEDIIPSFVFAVLITPKGLSTHSLWIIPFKLGFYSIKLRFSACSFNLKFECVLVIIQWLEKVLI